MNRPILLFLLLSVLYSAQALAHGGPTAADPNCKKAGDPCNNDDVPDGLCAASDGNLICVTNLHEMPGGCSSGGAAAPGVLVGLAAAGPLWRRRRQP